MRLGVLDVGSNTVHFLVVDAYRGARPTPVYSHKAELRLGDLLEGGTRLSDEGAQQLRAFVRDALQIAEDKGVEELLAFATSAVRDAANADEVIAQIREESDAHIQVLSGQDEARLTFLAARRWFGWSSGKLLVLDIGGGSLGIAEGGGGGPGDAGRPARPRGSHLEDVPAAGPHRGRRAVQRRSLHPAPAEPRRPDETVPQAGQHVRRGPGAAARGVPWAGRPARRGRHRGRRSHGPVRPGGTGPLPVGAPRGGGLA